MPQSNPTVRSFCSGTPRLDARIEPWMENLANHSSIKDLSSYGVPLNVIDTRPFRRNVAELCQVADSFGIDFTVFFARKANKCISFIHEMKSLGQGVDVASGQELIQVLATGMPAESVICTAAVKSKELIDVCTSNQVCIAIDNMDELQLVGNTDQPPEIALRVSGFEHDGNTLDSRFGFPVNEAFDLGNRVSSVKITGVHFHLDGYDASQRVSAIRTSLDLIKTLRSQGHPVRFLDMGGGFPVCYLENASQWEQFQTCHRKSLLGESPEITYRNHGLGLNVFENRIHGKMNVYPFYQEQNRKTWLTSVLKEVYRDLVTDNLELRCEPGRALLDGAGCTITKVEFMKKRARSNDHYIGLSLNRTQCRTGSDDFLIDPLLIKSDSARGTAIEGYFVGTYCTESELIFLRKFSFPKGIQRGDHILIPNTAGYFMHFLESRSHQFELAKNFVSNRGELDAIDCG